MEKLKNNKKLMIIIAIVVILIVAVLGIYFIFFAKIESIANVTGNSEETLTKNFESEQDVYNYANNIITSNNYSNLTATLDNSSKTLTISSKTMTEITESKDFAMLTFNIQSPTALTSYVKTQNNLKNEEKSVLNADWYNIQMLVKIEKHDVPLDTNNWYSNKSILISSSNGKYEFSGKDSVTIPTHDRSSNTGTIKDPKYTMTSKIGYNLYDINKFNNVISGDNVIITLILSKGTNENGEEEQIKLNVGNSEVLQDLSKFSKDFFLK